MLLQVRWMNYFNVNLFVITSYIGNCFTLTTIVIVIHLDHALFYVQLLFTNMVAVDENYKQITKKNFL